MAKREPRTAQFDWTGAQRRLQSTRDDDGPTDGDDGEDEDRPWTVTETCERVNRSLSAIAGGEEIRVEGEVGDCSLRDHWYFTLRDEQGAKLPCSFFRQRRRFARDAAKPEPGMKVVASGRLEYWTNGGRLSMIVSSLRDAGLGDLHQQFERLKTDLESRGWFDPGRRLPLPEFARGLLMLTSAAGAARRDVEETARQRWPGFRVHLAPIPVQGETATPRIADAIRKARRMAGGLGVDAIVLTRGGGSLEDLWCFNEEAVARAIVESRDEAVARAAQGGPPPIPLVAAIGHETDVSIAEFCADHRASTPTQAAMVLVPDADEHRSVIAARGDRLRLLARRRLELAAGRLALARRHEILRHPARLLDPHRVRLEDRERRLHTRMDDRVQAAGRRLEQAGWRLRAVSPTARLDRARERTDRAGARLAAETRRSIDRLRNRLDALEARLRAVGPDSVLQRGYALVLDEAGRPVREAGALSEGHAITARFSRGAVEATVQRVLPDDEPR